MLQRKKGILLISFGIAYIRDSARRPSLDRGGRKILTHYSPVRYCIIMVPQKWFHVNTVQLACVRPAASVHPEPGSNSFLFVCPHVNVRLFFCFSWPLQCHYVRLIGTFCQFLDLFISISSYQSPHLMPHHVDVRKVANNLV